MIVTVNDAPVNTVPGAQSVNEDTALSIAGVSVADVDSPPLTTTLTVTSGALNVTPGGGATIGGNGTAAVTLSGSAAQINAALAGLSYPGNLNFNGADTLTVSTGDGTAQDIDTVAITVNSVNDAPVNTVPGAQSVNEDTALSIAGVSVADVDGPALTTTLTVTSGALNVTPRWRRDDRRQRHRRRHAVGHAAQINAALAGLVLPGQPRLQRRRHAHGHRPATAPRGHRHGRDHRQLGERRAGEHGAGRAERQRGHAAARSPACRSRTWTASRSTTTLTVTNGALNVTPGGGATIGGNGTATLTLSGTHGRRSTRRSPASPTRATSTSTAPTR